MNALNSKPTQNAIRRAQAFARNFNAREWKFLCSYRWFLTGVDRMLSGSEVAALQLRAEDALIADGIRKPAENSDETLNGCHVTPWF
jgi:hypothetical protein